MTFITTKCSRFCCVWSKFLSLGGQYYDFGHPTLEGPNTAWVLRGAWQIINFCEIFSTSMQHAILSSGYFSSASFIILAPICQGMDAKSMLNSTTMNKLFEGINLNNYINFHICLPFHPVSVCVFVIGLYFRISSYK